MLLAAKIEEQQAELSAKLSHLIDQSEHVSEPLLTELATVSGLSDYFTQFLHNHPSNMELVASGDLDRVYGDDLAHRLLALEGEDFDDQIRGTRHREMARIIFRDFTRRADMVETTRDLSRLADASVESALKYHFDKNCVKYGKPLNTAGETQQMCVLALGKLGASELNLSSDIDLIFFYDESGHVEGNEDLTNQEFFLRTARQMIKSLDEIQVNGFVFRVDMRLRPYGDSGALILNRGAMEKYFIEQGRDWERYAFVKARAAAGDIALGEDFLKWLKPFVYRKHLDYGAVESLRDMKRMINNEVEQRSLKDDVKLGPGGIREVEFIVQAQQLIWGGNKPKFQHNRLLDTLSELVLDNHFPEEDEVILRQAYYFLRNSEHGIQGEKDKQTQKLPDDELGQARLAMVMGFEDYESFLSELQQHRSKVSACFAKLMSSNNAEEEILVEGNLFWVTIWNEPETDQSEKLLLKHGFTDIPKIRTALLELQQTVKGIQDIGFDRIQRLMPLMLSLCVVEEDPTETLIRLIPIVQGTSRRSTYVSFLIENMDALCRLVHLCGMSSWIAERVAQFPILMYEMTDKSTNEFRIDQQALRTELDVQLAQHDSEDLEAQMDTMRQFKHAMVLKVAIFELLNFLPTMKASDALTYIAELMLSKATDLTFEYLLRRHGEPCDKDGNALGRCFAVIAYGKLGGIELAYGSDLDVVFLHGADLHGETNGKKSVANNVFFSRFGQRLIHILSSMTRFGNLYEVDVRLRPDGNKGPLVSRFTAYERYLAQEAWTWELQALVRARHVAGEEKYGAKFAEIRQTQLAAPRETEKLKQAVADMRQKMRKNIKGPEIKGPEEVLISGFDLKQGVGAIVDIEFLVQYLVLANCHQYPELAAWTDKARLLEALQARDLLTSAEAELLKQAYVAYRSAVHYTWLGGQMKSYDQLNDFRSQVLKIWQAKFGTE